VEKQLESKRDTSQVKSGRSFLIQAMEGPEVKQQWHLHVRSSAQKYTVSQSDDMLQSISQTPLLALTLALLLLVLEHASPAFHSKVQALSSRL
jgi:hypothetical protein